MIHVDRVGPQKVKGVELYKQNAKKHIFKNLKILKTI